MQRHSDLGVSDIPTPYQYNFWSLSIFFKSSELLNEVVETLGGTCRRVFYWPSGSSFRMAADEPRMTGRTRRDSECSTEGPRYLECKAKFWVGSTWHLIRVMRRHDLLRTHLIGICPYVGTVRQYKHMLPHFFLIIWFPSTFAAVAAHLLGRRTQWWRGRDWRGWSTLPRTRWGRHTTTMRYNQIQKPECMRFQLKMKQCLPKVEGAIEVAD